MRGYDSSQIVFGILTLPLLIIVPYVLLSKALLNLSFDIALNNGCFQTTFQGGFQTNYRHNHFPNTSHLYYKRKPCHIYHIYTNAPIHLHIRGLGNFPRAYSRNFHYRGPNDTYFQD